jgi:hypothetical protein
MAVVRGDRIAESKKLNLCSFSAHVAYGTFVGCVPDDFGRFRATPTAIAERMFPRREADRRKIEAAIRGWLAEWAEDHGAGALVKLWTVDGVQWGEMTGWKQTGNLNHRTPEPPWSVHEHDGRCVTTALARAREWGPRDDVEKLTLQLKRIREQNSNRGRSRTRTEGGYVTGLCSDSGAAEPEHPSSPSSPSSSSSPSSRDNGRGEGAAPVENRTAPPARSLDRGNGDGPRQVTAVTAETAKAITDLAEQLAGDFPEVPVAEWIARASRIEPDSRGGGRVFHHPREPGVTESWARVTLRSLQEEAKRVHRLVGPS